MSICLRYKDTKNNRNGQIIRIQNTKKFYRFWQIFTTFVDTKHEKLD